MFAVVEVAERHSVTLHQRNANSPQYIAFYMVT